MTITISAEELTTFHTLQQWVARQEIALQHHKSEVVICVASNGTLCHIGKDFEFASKNNLFPVKAYRLVRAVEG